MEEVVAYVPEMVAGGEVAAAVTGSGLSIGSDMEIDWRRGVVEAGVGGDGKIRGSMSLMKE